MWVQLGTWAVTLVGIAAGANLLALGRSRRMSTMRAEAELVDLLPDGMARDALSRKLSEDILSHIHLERSKPARRARQVRDGFLYVGIVLTVAYWSVLVIALTTDPRPSWVAVALPVGSVTLLATGVAIVYVNRRVRKISEASEDEAANEVRVERVIRATDQPVEEVSDELSPRTRALIERFFREADIDHRREGDDSAGE